MWNCSIEEGVRTDRFQVCVKGIGEEKGDRILKAREEAFFTSMQDFADRAGIDNKSTQNLMPWGHSVP